VYPFDEPGGGGGGGFAGLPPDWKMFQLSQPAGMNAKDPRPAIGDQETAWQENFLRFGNGLRTMWDVGPTLYSAPGGVTVVSFFPFNIGSTQYHAVFLSDGTAVQVRVSDGAVTTISATPNTFFVANGTRPGCAQWGSAGIVIVSTSQANGYWAWDGTFYAPGGASPSWLNGGTPTTMPTGFNGTAVEIFQSRVWIINGGSITFSAPGNGANFASAAGGGTAVSTDSFLKIAFLAIKQANGYLYPFGDSSIQVISNVQTAGSPAITTFNNQNTDPQVGTPWRDSVVAFGKALYFANATGLYGLVGSTAEKLTEKFDVLFANANPPVTGTALPSAAVTTMFNVKVYLLLITIVDPFTGAPRPVMLGWDGKTAFIASQSKTPTYIATQQLNSDPIAWATDGSTLFQMFAHASQNLTKKLQTKLWAGDGFIIYKQALRFYSQAADNAGSGFNLSVLIDTELQSGVFSISGLAAFSWVNNVGGVFFWQNNSAGVFTWGSTGGSISGRNVDSVYGLELGLTITSTSADFTLITLALGYRNYSSLA
jgi:hypothetical protein